MEAEGGERDALSRHEPGIVKELPPRGAETTRRPGCGGQLDRITGVGSPTHRLVEWEVGLRLGDGVGQQRQPGLLFPAWRPTSGAILGGLALSPDFYDRFESEAVSRYVTEGSLSTSSTTERSRPFITIQPSCRALDPAEIVILLALVGM